MNKSVTYTLKKGEQFPIQITVKNGDTKEPIDLTGYVVRVQVRDEISDVEPLIEKEITIESDEQTVGRITDPTNGKFTIYFNQDDHELFVISRVYYLTIWLENETSHFKKVISSNGCNQLILLICAP